MAKNFLVPINMNGLEIQNFLAHKLASAPTGVAGKLYFNTVDHKLYYYDGTNWIALEANPAAITIDSALSSTSTNPVQNKVINTALGNKVDVVSGKGLSTNDYTTTEKNKLSGIAAGAEVNVQANWTETDSTSDAYIKNKPTLGAAAAKGVDSSISSGSTSTNLPTSGAVASLVSTAVGAVDAMRFKGTIGTTGDISALPTTGVKVGDTYMVVTAGTYAGQTCEVGDLIIATATTPTWTVAQTNINGAITSISGIAPLTATSNGSSSIISITAASGSAAGSMSSAHYTKLEGIETGAEKNRTYTATTGKPIGNRSPGFGGSFEISQISQSTTGQITATDRTITIPDTVATQSSSGLMSASDKATLDGLATGSTVKAVELAWGSGETKTISDLTVAKLVSYIAVDSNDDVVVIDCNTSSSGTTFSVASANNTPSKLYIKYIGTVSWT